MLLRQDLDRDAPVQSGVDRLEDFAHRACAELSLDAVCTEDRSRRGIRHVVILPGTRSRMRELDPDLALRSIRASSCRSAPDTAAWERGLGQDLRRRDAAGGVDLSDRKLGRAGLPLRSLNHNSFDRSEIAAVTPPSAELTVAGGDAASRWPADWPASSGRRSTEPTAPAARPR